MKFDYKLQTNYYQLLHFTFFYDFYHLSVLYVCFVCV